MPIIAPGVARFTLHGTLLGQSVANVLDMFIETTGSTADRPSSVEGQAGIILENWAGDIVPNLSSNYAFTRVSWVDLDSTSGTTGERLSSGAVTLPVNGTIAGDSYTNAASFFVTKQIQGARGRRSGRFFLPGVPEGQASGNTAASAQVTALQADFDAFLSDINQAGSPTSYSSFAVVVHTTVPPLPAPQEPVFVARSQIDAFVVSSQLATQRRRMPPR